MNTFFACGLFVYFVLSLPCWADEEITIRPLFPDFSQEPRPLDEGPFFNPYVTPEPLDEGSFFNPYVIERDGKIEAEISPLYPTTPESPRWMREGGYFNPWVLRKW